MKKRVLRCLTGLIVVLSLAGAMTVSGTVTDAVTGNALSGVLVMVDKYEGRYPGFNTQVITDAEGKYQVDYTPTAVADNDQVYYRPENALFSVYDLQGKQIRHNLSGTALSSVGRDVRPGIYLAGYEIDGERTLKPLMITRGATVCAGLQKEYAVKLAAAASLQEDTLVSFSKDGYTTQALIKSGNVYDIALYPRTAIGTKPGPGNTGPTGPLRLGGGSLLQAGQVTDGYYFFALVISQADVTIRNFIIDGGGLLYAIDSKGTGLVMEDGEIINSGMAGIYGANYTARRLNIHEHYTDAIKPWGNVTVEGSWIHHLGIREDAHADGVQIREGSNYTFRKNHFEMPITVPLPYKTNANLFITADTGETDNVLIEDNWLDGGNYTIYSEYKPDKHCCGCPTNVRVLNNRFTYNYMYGVMAGECFDEWSGNVLLED